MTGGQYELTKESFGEKQEDGEKPTGGTSRTQGKQETRAGSAPTEGKKIVNKKGKFLVLREEKNQEGWVAAGM